VTNENGSPISPPYLFDIEVYHCIPAPYVLGELARVLALDYDSLLAQSGGADIVVREYLQTHPDAEAGVIRLFRAAQQHQFDHWDQLLDRVLND
jgi:hypothetical protein